MLINQLPPQNACNTLDAAIVAFDQNQMRRLITTRLDSGEFWIFLCDRFAAGFLDTVERNYYWGAEANPDFEIGILPGRFVGLGASEIVLVATAHKRRMNAAQLGEIVMRTRVVDEMPDYSKQDVLILLQTVLRCKVVGEAFMQWLFTADEANNVAQE